MSRAVARSIFVFIFVINCILLSRSRYGTPNHLRASLVRRFSVDIGELSATGDECRPRSFPAVDQCRHVESKCPPSDTLLNIDYLHYYFCNDESLRPLVFASLVIWTIFLFSTLGISASDFFTPNLATIAQLLGLDENVAGVTFLAFGNGSPDVFSTFSAMRANSGSLAIGELLGAATFIVSCVVGSVCIINPFQVPRGPFLRDVGFFTIAVGLVLATIWDGQISSWEAGLLVGLYVLYVALVVIGSWWEGRQERKRRLEDLIRSEYAEEPTFPIYIDEPLPELTVPPTSPNRARAISAPTQPLRIQTNVGHRHSRSHSPSPANVGQMPSFSLIGALEFRDVVASLKSEAAGTSLGMFDSPITPYAGGHYHKPAVRSLRQVSSDEEAMNSLHLGTRSTTSDSDATIRGQPGPGLPGPSDDLNGFSHESRHELPSITRTPASPSLTVSEVESEEQLYIPPTKRQCIGSILRQIFHTLFPTLSNFRQQSALSKIACVLAAPAVLCLTLTLPIVVTPYGNDTPSPGKTNDARLIEFEEEGQERVLIAEEEEEENMHQLRFNKWLVAVQCVLGSLFCAMVIFDGTQHEVWYLAGTGIAGFAAAVYVLLFSNKGDNIPARMARCSMGFVVAVVWIMAIADEVVNILQTFGMIFGLSDAIIGLTIFAVGNSLADLVANMSVAVFAPLMGFSACFGGPMLNILLGIGISGSYIISQTGQSYQLKISRTLFISSFGLLFLLAATLIFVPLNDYYLTRRWGILLIASFAVIMIINVVVELKT